MALAAKGKVIKEKTNGKVWEQLTFAVFGSGDGISRDQGEELEQLNTILEVSVEILDLVILLHQVGVHPLGEGLLLHIGAILLLLLELTLKLVGLEGAAHASSSEKRKGK